MEHAGSFQGLARKTGYSQVQVQKEYIIYLGVLSAWLDGQPWKLEAVGSNPTTQTKEYFCVPRTAYKTESNSYTKI